MYDASEICRYHARNVFTQATRQMFLFWMVRKSKLTNHHFFTVPAFRLIDSFAFMGGTMAVPNHWFGGRSGRVCTS